MGLVPPEQQLAPAPQQRPRFPLDVIGEKSRVLDARTGPQVTERGEPAEGIPAEQRPPVHVLLPAPDEDPGDRPDEEPSREAATHALAHRISRRAESAWAM